MLWVGLVLAILTYMIVLGGSEPDSAEKQRRDLIDQNKYFQAKNNIK